VAAAGVQADRFEQSLHRVHLGSTSNCGAPCHFASNLTCDAHLARLAAAQVDLSTPLLSSPLLATPLVRPDANGGPPLERPTRTA